MKITDGNGEGMLNCHKAMRRKIFGHLLDAKKTLAAAHPAHGDINKAVNELGGVFVTDRSEDDSGDPGDLTSPGTRTNLPSRIGADTHVGSPSTRPGRATAEAMGIAARAQSPMSLAKARRDSAVVDLYAIAARQPDKKKQAAIEKVAAALDALPEADLVRKFGGGVQFIGVGGTRKTWMERHFGE